MLLLVTDLLIFTNVAMGLILGVSSMIVVMKNHNSMRWLDAFESIVGFYFAAIYAYAAIIDSGDTGIGILGPVFVRPAITVLLAVLAAGAIVRMRIRRNV